MLTVRKRAIAPPSAIRTSSPGPSRVIGGVEFGRIGVELGLERDDLLPYIAADLVDQHLLFGVGLEIHGRFLDLPHPESL